VMAPSPCTNTIDLLSSYRRTLFCPGILEAATLKYWLRLQGSHSIHHPSHSPHCLSLDVSRKLGRRCAADGAARFLFLSERPATRSFVHSFPVGISTIHSLKLCLDPKWFSQRIRASDSAYTSLLTVLTLPLHRPFQCHSLVRMLRSKSSSSGRANRGWRWCLI
jgi:hypothetical protein